MGLTPHPPTPPIALPPAPVLGEGGEAASPPTMGLLRALSPWLCGHRVFLMPRKEFQSRSPGPAPGLRD